MADFMLDSVNHDLKIINGRLMMTSGGAAIAQRLKQRLLLIKGEWFLNTDEGFDWIDGVFNAKVNKEFLEARFLRYILETDGISEVSSINLELNKQTRLATMNLTAKIEDGSTITESVSLEVN